MLGYLLPGTSLGDYGDGLSRAKSILNGARQRMKSFADQRRRELELEVGDSVLLSTKHLPIKSPGTPKFWPRFIGPFFVKERVGSVAYKLDLPSSLKIHPVFHISLLHPYKSDGRVQPPPAPIEVDGGLEWEVDKVLSHRDRKQGKRVLTSYLVAWKGFGPEHNSFEPEKNLRNCRALVEEYWQGLVQRTAAGLKRSSAAQQGRRTKRKLVVKVPQLVGRRTKRKR